MARTRRLLAIVMLSAMAWLTEPSAQAGINNGDFQNPGGWRYSPTPPPPGTTPPRRAKGASGSMVGQIGAAGGGVAGAPRGTIFQTFTCGAGNAQWCGIAFDADFTKAGQETAHIRVEDGPPVTVRKVGNIPNGKGRYQLSLAGMCQQKLTISFYIDSPNPNAPAAINSLLEIDNVTDGCQVSDNTSANLTVEDASTSRSTGPSGLLSTFTKLSVQPSPAGGVSLSWPANGSGSILESSINLASGSWSTVPQLPVLVNGQFVMHEPAMTGNRFYRLRESASNSVPDTIPPTLASITPSAVGDRITLTFSEPVDELTATNLHNYYLADTDFHLVLPQSALLPEPRSVDLLIDPPLLPGAHYYLGVEGVRDLAGNVMVPDTRNFAAPNVSQTVPLDCNTGFGDDYYVCAADIETAKSRAKAQALEIFRSIYRCQSPCYPHVTASTAETTGIQCKDFTSEWKVHVDIICAP
jgi:hypothetical protein